MRLLTKILTAAFFAVFYRVTIIGADNIPQNGGAVLCSNHVGELDMFFLGFKIKRWVYYMAKEELFKIPLLGGIIRQLGAFPVKRGKGDIESIKTAIKLVRDGHILGIFPEGTRMAKKGAGTVKAKAGAALIAVKAEAPVIPVAIKGSYKLFSKVKIIFGKPYRLDTAGETKPSGSDLTDMSQDIMNKIYNLLEEN